MIRRRSQPWIYRWSRPLIGAIAIVGALLTAYLTWTKLTGGQVVCSADAVATAGCNSVLDSRYGSVFGLPLSLFGSLAYTGMATVSLAPLLVKSENNKRFRIQLENSTWLLLLIGATSMAVFSGYLMYILFSELNTVCYYCIGSAIFCLSLLMLTIFGNDWEDIGQIFFTGIIVAMVTLVGTLAINATQWQPIADITVIPKAKTQPEAPYGWDITTKSGAAEIALAKHLTSVGAKMYGAYWCPHCYEQKQLFGKKALQEINYIECAPQGKAAQPQLCNQVGIKSYPTWEIQGQQYPGLKILKELAKLSGYQGEMNFKYTLH